MNTLVIVAADIDLGYPGASEQKPDLPRQPPYLLERDEMSRLEQAIALAAEAHSGQVDKAGKPYILHPLRVMLAVSDASKECAVLHDMVEDCPGYDLRLLEKHGFHPVLLAAVDAITKRPGEEYEAYLNRVASNPIALEVKLADLRDNMDESRGAPPNVKREAKYRLALAKLTQAA